MRQLHIFSVKPKLDMGLFVDFCVFAWIWLNLPDQNLKLFCFDVQNSFMFRSDKFSQMDKWEYQNKPCYLENRAISEPCKQRTACTYQSIDQYTY